MQLRRFEFEDEIWAVRPEWNGGRWAVQTRNAAARCSDFHLLPTTSDIPSRFTALDDSWWKELAAFHPKGIVLSGYQDASLPVLDRLIALEVESGRIMWERAQTSFAGLAEVGVFGYDLERAEEVLLQLPSGEISQEKQMKQVESRFLFPKWMPSDKGMELAYLEIDGLELAAWHEPEQDSQDLWLEIGGKGMKDWRICLERGMQKLHPEPFMVHERQVVAIQDRRNLLLIDLP